MTHYAQEAKDFLKKYGRWLFGCITLGLSLSLFAIIATDYIVGINKDSARIARNTVEIARSQAALREMDKRLTLIDQRLDAVEIGLGRMALELDEIKQLAVEYVRQQQVKTVKTERIMVRVRHKRAQSKAGS